ncbi:MAG TPA: YicC family protein [Gammaproteobacteria bacterium]|nr:YicC family protein [Gammaproteobacteria bacterium]
MVNSMTAFARRVAESGLGQLTWEMRSVNHRYREVAIRLPEELRAVEGAFRDAISAKIGRGRVDAMLRYAPPVEDVAGRTLDEGAVRQLSQWATQVRAILPAAEPLRVVDALKWPGVVSPPLVDETELAAAATELLNSALGDLVAGRAREGGALAGIIRDKAASAHGVVQSLRQALPQIEQHQRQRLAERLADYRTQLDPDRLEQEMVILLSRSDVAEEIDRLVLHLDEVDRVLGQDEPVGRRLDFLMQELNREANTLGSKSAHPEMTAASVDLKVLIEQMREQVQNIE